jgi:zinc protease
VQASGGKAAYEKLTSRVEKGTFEIPAMGVGGPIEINSKLPNKNLVTVTFEGMGVYQEGFTGTVGWSLDPSGEIREKSGAELATAKRNADFYGPIHMKERFPKMEVKSKQKVGDKEAYVVVATPTEGSPETLYFDAQTGLIIRQEMDVESPQGKMHADIYLEDYREVDGVKVPFTVKQNSDAISFVIKLTEVKHNVPIEDAKFNKPASQQ